MVKYEEMKQTICQYEVNKQLLILENELMEELESRIEAAQWKEITRETPTGYLVE